MSLPKNVAANYLGQTYLAVLSFALLPAYLRYLGPEAYGLVGFFTMLQAWFVLLDLGLTPTLARELARFRAGALDRGRLTAMVRTLEWLFGGVGAVAALGVGLAAGWIARDWLKPQHLAAGELQASIVGMGVMIALRGGCGLYRGGLAGLEKMVALNVVAVALGTLRSVGVLAVLAWWSTRPSVFFAYQAVVAVIELAVTAAVFYRAFPMRGAGPAPSWASLRGLLGLSGGMAFLAGLWIVFSQTDRLVLSWTLDLRDYGCFAVAASLAGAISLLAAPVSQALQPRLSLLAAQERHDELVALYRLSLQATGAGAGAVAGVMACWAGPLLQAWTGHPEVAAAAARVLPLYAAGNAVAALLGLAFLVQFAYGQVRWQVIGNLLFGAVWIPGAYFAAVHAGAVGTGWVWLVGNLAFFLLWLPYVHRRLLPGLGGGWLIADLGPVAVAVGLGALAASRLDLGGAGRFGALAAAAALTGALTLAGLLAGGATRRLLLERWRRYALVKAS